MSRFADLKGFVDGLEDDFNKFYEKGNKAAGTRVRKAMQDIKESAQAVRKKILEVRSEQSSTSV
ncbi:MAG: histone H1 [Bacteroidetes bacterium]|nr:histone H1 [Bacteroidota bacterium]